MKKGTKKIDIKKLVEHKAVDISNSIVEAGMVACVGRFFNNEHTQEDILRIGEWLTEFKKTEAYQIMVSTINYVINTELDIEKKVGVNNDETIGIQRGARRVLTTLMGLDKAAIIVGKQMDNMREQQKSEEEGTDVNDPENLEPVVQNLGRKGI